MDMPSIEVDLRTFLAEASAGRKEATCARYRRVLDHLRRYLETVDAGQVLGTYYGNLLDAEREFHPDGAFARLFTAHDVILCLPGFVDEAWLLPTPADARSQISLTERLLRWIGLHRPSDGSFCSCGVYECKAAIRRARIVLRRPAGQQPSL